MPQPLTSSSSRPAAAGACGARSAAWQLSAREPGELAGLGEQREAVRHPPVLDDPAVHDGARSNTVMSMGLLLGGPKKGPVAVPRARTRTQAPRYSMRQVVAGIPITPMSTSVHT